MSPDRGEGKIQVLLGDPTGFGHHLKYEWFHLNPSVFFLCYVVGHLRLNDTVAERCQQAKSVFVCLGAVGGAAITGA